MNLGHLMASHLKDNGHLTWNRVKGKMSLNHLNKEESLEHLNRACIGTAKWYVPWNNLGYGIWHILEYFMVSLL